MRACSDLRIYAACRVSGVLMMPSLPQLLASEPVYQAISALGSGANAVQIPCLKQLWRSSKTARRSIVNARPVTGEGRVSSTGATECAYSVYGSMVRVLMGGAGASHVTYPGVLDHGTPLCQAGSRLGKVGESV